MNKGSLVIVGTGIRSVGQLTIESIAWIERADKVLYVVSEPIAESLILRLNPAAESLQFGPSALSRKIIGVLSAGPQRLRVRSGRLPGM
jgi:hypothetical protein